MQTVITRPHFHPYHHAPAKGDAGNSGHVVASRALYGGIHTISSNSSFVDVSDLEMVSKPLSKAQPLICYSNG
jgi:hypothetical protein